MPKVGNQKFAYTPEGEARAEEYAEETGQEVIPTYDAGGRTQRIEGWGNEPSGPSNLVANGEMTDEEVVKYLNPQATSKHGGKLEATTKYEDGEKIRKQEKRKRKDRRIKSPEEIAFIEESHNLIKNEGFSYRGRTFASEAEYQKWAKKVKDESDRDKKKRFEDEKKAYYSQKPKSKK